MDDQRPIKAAELPEGGWLICTCGHHSLYILKDGKFRIVDKNTGHEDIITSEDLDELHEISENAKEWGGHHCIKE